MLLDAPSEPLSPVRAWWKRAKRALAQVVHFGKDEEPRGLLSNKSFSSSQEPSGEFIGVSPLQLLDPLEKLPFHRPYVKLSCRRFI